MKSTRSAIVVAASLLLLVSCSQKGEAPAGMQESQGSLVSDAKSGFCILNNLAFWDQQSNGALKWKASVQLGEKLQLLDQTVKAVEPGSSTEREFIQVRRDSGVEGWIRSEYVVPNSILGVITSEEAVIYTQPKNTAATAEAIPNLTVLAVLKDSAGQSFIKVTLFDKYLRSGIFLRNEGVSTRSSDVESAILLILARQSDKENLKKTFLESAKKDYPDSIFAATIDGALSVLADPTAGREVEEFSESLVSRDDNVNVRAKPHEESLKVGKLMKGQQVDVVQKTTQEFAIGNTSAPWFKIKDPEGWVWGGYLGSTQE
jgi:hypothetical protein